MGFWRMGGKHSYPCEILVISIALLLQLRSVSCLHCYECTSEDPDCDKDFASTPTLIKECGEDALGCVIYAVYYDYVFGAIFHRSCVYSYDFRDFQKRQGWIQGLNSDGYMQALDLEYNWFIENWNTSRFYLNPSAISSIPHVKHAPSGISGSCRLRVFFENKFGNLSNGQEFSKWTWYDSFEWDKAPKKIDSVECYSCEFEIKGKEIRVEEDNYDVKLSHRIYGIPPEYNLPPCSSKDASPLKKVTCKNAYGCATFLEMKNASKLMNPADGIKRTGDIVSRVWRGCWYPGDQKCLRNPKNLTLTLAERALASSSKGRKETDMETKECEDAYARVFKTGDGVVVWPGVKRFDSSKQYNEYLECRHKVRLGVNAESQLKLVEEKVDEEYTWIQYQFCGPESKCNKYEGVYADEVGKRKYNPKDYEDLDQEKTNVSTTTATTVTTGPEPTKKNRTQLDKCSIDEGGSKGSEASVFSINSISLLFLTFLSGSTRLVLF